MSGVFCEVEPVDVLAGLRSSIERLDVSRYSGAELAALLATTRAAQRCLDGLVIKIGVCTRHAAAKGLGAPAEEVMRGEGAVGAKQARREAARACVATQVDGLGDAVSAGDTTGEHVDVIARHIAGLSEPERAAFDATGLVEKATQVPVETFARIVKRRVDAATADHGLKDTKAKQAASEFRHWYDIEAGMGRFTGALDPERYEALTNAIEQRSAAIATRTGEPVTKTRNLAAEALVELVSAEGVIGSDGRAARRRLPSITVVVDHDTIVSGAHNQSIRRTENGRDLPPETIARLCCDATIRRVTLDRSGVPINVGRKYRTATDGQWAAIKAVHADCAWHGCDAPINWCQAHHIQEWDNNGPTDLHNLVPLCSRHHHRVHEGQWQIKLLPDRTLEIYKPNGTHHSTAQRHRLNTLGMPQQLRASYAGEVASASAPGEPPEPDRSTGATMRHKKGHFDD